MRPVPPWVISVIHDICARKYILDRHSVPDFHAGRETRAFQSKLETIARERLERVEEFLSTYDQNDTLKAYDTLINIVYIDDVTEHLDLH